MNDDDLALSPKEAVEAFETLLVHVATGGSMDGPRYAALRQRLIEDTVVGPMLPSYVRTCRNTGQFWAFIKKTEGYQPRRELLWADFGAIIERLSDASPADVAIGDTLRTLDLDEVHAIWQRALARRSSDPEAAITSARSLIESTCKHILDALGQKYDPTADLTKLYRQTAKSLNLAPDQHSEELFRQILGGCHAVVEGLGAIRNRLSDAHGKGKGAPRPAPRHAELAVNLAGAMATFLVSSWTTRSTAA